MVTDSFFGLLEPQYMKEGESVVEEDCSLPGGRKAEVEE